MKLRIVLFLFVSLVVRGYAQPALAWSQRYNGPPDYSDEAHDLVVDNAGNIYVTGSAFASNGTLDMVTIKYSAGGQQLWLQSYNGTANDNDEAYKIVMSDSGFVYVVGYSKNTNMQDLTVIKYSPAGVQLWAATYDGAFHNYDVGNSVAVDANGNVYVTGVETESNYTYDYVTVKYSAGGVQQWAQTYNGPGNFNDESRDIALDANGNVYVTGPSDTFYNSQPNADIVLLKYNNAGTLQWRRVFDSAGHGYEYSKKLTIDQNNDIIIAGYGFITGNGNDYYILKYSSAGNFQWLRNYNYSGTSFEEPYGIVADNSNNIYITGQGVTPNANNTHDYVTVKYDAGGTFQWAQRYDNTAIGNSDDYGYALCLDDSNNVYVTGKSGTSTNFDIATVKYDPAGNQKFVLRYNNNSANKNDVGNAVRAKGGEVWVCGLSDNLTNSDYITLRYSYSAIGMPEYGSIPSLRTFPNPANDEIRIEVTDNSNTGSNAYSVEILNELGQSVLVVTPALTESAGNKNVLLIHTASLAPGVYTAKVSDGDKAAGVSRFVVQ